jgi:hypothetical protein
MFQHHSTVCHIADTVTIAHPLHIFYDTNCYMLWVALGGKLDEHLQLDTGSSVGRGKPSFTPKSQAITKPVKCVLSIITRKKRRGNKITRIAGGGGGGLSKSVT